MTTGAYTSAIKTAPSRVSLVGNSAQWILEAPSVEGGQLALARYGDVYFDDCVAQTKLGVDLVSCGRGPEGGG